MKLQGFSPVTKADVQELPDWAERVFGPLNAQVAALTSMLQGQASTENLYVELREFRIKSAQSVDLSLQKIKTKVAGVFLAYVDGDYFASMKWKPIDQGKIRVTIDFSTVSGLGTGTGSIPSGEILVRLKVEGV